MIVKKRINNNVILAEENAKEMIVTGKGIGFRAYPKDEVDQTKVEQLFLPTGKWDTMQIAALLKDTDIADIQLAEAIILIGEKLLQQKIQRTSMLSLLDHIIFALERSKEKIAMKSPIEWEVKHFYPQEMKIGEQAVELINRIKGVKLPESEQIFIALHFVHYQIDSSATMPEMMTYLETIRDITQMIKFEFQMEIDEDSVYFQRFLHHLKCYLLIRKGEEEKRFIRQPLARLIKEDYQREFKCARKIDCYLTEKYGVAPSSDEQVYLTLHLARLIQTTE